MAGCVWCGDVVEGACERIGGQPIHFDCVPEFNAEFDEAFPAEDVDYGQEPYEPSPYNGDDDSDPGFYSDEYDDGDYPFFDDQDADYGDGMEDQWLDGSYEDS